MNCMMGCHWPLHLTNCTSSVFPKWHHHHRDFDGVWDAWVSGSGSFKQRNWQIIEVSESRCFVTIILKIDSVEVYWCMLQWPGERLWEKSIWLWSQSIPQRFLTSYKSEMRLLHYNRSLVMKRNPAAARTNRQCPPPKVTHWNPGLPVHRRHTKW